MSREIDAKFFSKLVCLSRVPAMTDIERMGVTRRPVAYFRPLSAAGKSYRALWSELREKEKG
jgi:hypothetical protein